MNTIKKYNCLPEPEYTKGAYRLVSIREQDILKIKQWRNEQLTVLRQTTELTDEKQREYFEKYIWPSFPLDQPRQILFSYLFEDECIGYGGLVHIRWEDNKAEISFLVNTKRSKDKLQYKQDFGTYLSLIRNISFNRLNLNRLYTETFEFREDHTSILEESGFVLEGRMRKHVFIENQYFDSIIHGCLKADYVKE